MTTTFTLKAIDAFTCTGSDCEASCCRTGWDILVEPALQEKWKNTESGAALLDSLNTKILGGVVQTVLGRDEQGNCRQLTSDGLCRIRSELGTEYLPPQCASFPRQLFKSDSTRVHSATLACPEVARLVTEPNGADIFVEGDIADPDLANMDSGMNALENYLDRWTRLVLQADGISVPIKLYYLGKVINDLNTFAEAGQLNEQTLATVCRQYRDSLQTMTQAVEKGELQADSVSAGWFWEMIHNFSQEPLRHLAHHYEINDPVNSLNIPARKKKEQDFIRVYETVNDILRDTSSEIGELQPALLQYLKTAFINMGFPWNPIGGNYIASYVKTVIHFTSAWYLLALVVKTKGSADRQDLVRVIYNVERAYFHDPMVANTMKKNPALFEVGNYLGSLLDLK